MYSDRLLESSNILEFLGSYLVSVTWASISSVLYELHVGFGSMQHGFECLYNANERIQGRVK